MKPIALVVACATLLRLAAALPAEAKTFDLQLVVYCPDAAGPCGEDSEQKLASKLFNRIEEVNLEWMPTGFSFRPLPIQFNYGAGQRALSLTDSDGASTLAGVSNATLSAELRQQAALTPNVVTLFLIPGLAKCWSAIPPSSSLDNDPHTGFFCTPSAGGRSYAHELGHHFCLRHTFSGQDLGTHGLATDHDGDDGSKDTDWYGHYEFGVNDTPADPGRLENYKCTKRCADDLSVKCKKNSSCRNAGLGDCICKPGHDVERNGDPIVGQEWCIPTMVSDVDPDSPHPSYCTAACVLGVDGGVSDSAFAPSTRNAMSYYGTAGCRGPYVRNGNRSEAFSPDQIAAIQACAADPLLPWRSDLPDVCAGRGGDGDYDGICDDDDSCPRQRDTWVSDYSGDDVPDIADRDRDGFGDACDVCIDAANLDQSDTDGDGTGDLCDVDIDNDGCLNGPDLRQAQAQAVVGHWTNGACTPPGGNLYRFEGEDSDGDSVADCADADDDNDGLLDGDDPCPIHPHDSLACQEVRQCSDVEWSLRFEPFDEGMLRELRVRFVDEFYPSSFDELEFRGVGVRRLNPSELETRELFVNPIRDWGVWENINVIAEGPQSRARAAGRWRVELWYKDIAKIGDLALLNPASIMVDTQVRGSLIKLRLGSSGSEQPRMGGAWVAGAGDGALPGGDGDSDSVPGVIDNCGSVANPEQNDRDSDGLGDLCDADFDGDAMVSADEYKRVRQCVGWGTARFTETGDCGASDDAATTTTVDTSKEAAQQARGVQMAQLRAEKKLSKKGDCEAADLDDNGVVDKLDVVIAKSLYAADK